MAATVTAAATIKGVTKSLISRTLERCKSGLTAAAGRAAAPVAGCFSVYVGPERERFVVRAKCANHPLFRRLLDDAEREYGYATQGPLALPCDVDAFLDVLWQMEDEDGEIAMAAAAASPICGRLSSGSKGRAAGYRMLSPARTSLSRSSPMVGGRRCPDCPSKELTIFMVILEAKEAIQAAKDLCSDRRIQLELPLSRLID